MNPAVSIYLDAVRFAAALLVLVGHLAGARFTGGLFWQAGAFLDDAVTVFFVLSGFVIAHVTATRERDWRSYVRSRAVRIVPVAVAALVLTVVLDAAGQAVRPELYSAGWGYGGDHLAWRIAACLLFVNQVWILDVAPGSDLPYWSLGFEVWYYAAFGAALFARRGVAWAAVCCLLAGPRIVSMFPLWLAGVACQRACAWLGQRRVVSAAAFPAAVAALVAVEALGVWLGWPAIPDGAAPFVQAGLVRGYVVGLLFCATIAGLAVAPGWAARVARDAGPPVRWLAGATFSLYLFHMPVAQALAAWSPFATTSVANRAVVLGGTILASFLLAEAVERRKQAVRRVFAPG